MSLQSKDRKISKFQAQTSLPSDAQFTYISNNVNYRITLANFQASLGVTGTIEQDGAVTGTPILDKAGSVNNIRNLEDGPGIRTSVSPENGATIEHNFQTDTTGIELVDDLNADSPTFRSLVGGAGINVAVSGDTIQIASSAIPASTKTVIVNELSDFPTPSAGVITLADNTEYAVRNDINTVNRFVFGNNTVISGSDESVVNLAYSGTGDMFTGVNVTSKIKNIRITCASGTFINFTGTGSEIFQLLDSTVVADTLGTIGALAGLQLASTQIQATTDGFTFTGSNGVFLVAASLDTIAAGTFFDLGTATFDGISFTDCFATLSGSSVFMSGLAASGNINTGALGSIHNCRFFGTGTVLSGITESDIRWQFFINDDIQETHKDILMSQIGNTTNTVITTISTPVKLAGTWVQDHGAQFTTDATGRMTYNGVKDTHFSVTMAFTGAPVSGTNIAMSYYVAKNGVTIPNSEASSLINSGSPERITLIWLLTLQTGDYIEAFVENNTNTNDILITEAQMRIS